MATLEIHIPISPTRKFFVQTQFLVHSIRKNGGKYRDAKIVITVGDTTIYYDIYERLPWLKKHNVEIRWVPRGLFEDRSSFATATDRFIYEYESDVVLLLDADTALIRNVDDLIERAHHDQSLCAVLAYASPLENGMEWSSFWSAANLGEPKLEFQHPGYPTLWLQRNEQYCPAYFNLGMIAAPSSVMSSVGALMYPMMDLVSSLFDTRYRCQIGLALAIGKLNSPFSCMPLRFNFGNIKQLEDLYPDDLSDVRLVHYMSEQDGFEREKVFYHRSGMEDFLNSSKPFGTTAILRGLLGDMFDDVAREQVLNLAPFRWD